MLHSTAFLPGKAAKKRVFELPLTLHPAQQTIEDSPARFKIVRAGRKFGKSTKGECTCIKKSGKPGSVIWYLGPTYRQTKLIAWKEFKTLIPREALAKKPNETDLFLTLKNGSEIYLMGGDNPDSLRGPAPDHVELEEAAMLAPEVWSEVIRPNLTARKGSAEFITTPKGYNWFKDLEDQARALVAAGNSEWAAFHYTIYDNPYIDREEIEKARKECDSDAVWRQEYMAEYESSVGRVFSQFSEDRNCRSLSVGLTTFDAYRGIDYGMRDDTGCVWGRIEGNKLEIYREHAIANLPASTQAEMILNKTTGSEKVEMNSISHDAAKQDAQMQGLTVKWHFENAGIRPLYVSSRDKKASRQMIQRLIQEDRLVIDKTACPKLVRQLLAYEWKDTLLEKTVDGHDDLVDALHYLVELLQFKLFLDGPVKAEKTMDQIFKEIEAEKRQQREKPKLKLPVGDHGGADLNFENSSAGYL